MADSIRRTIIVADSNILRPTNARRYLLGLAGTFGFELALVPELMDELPRTMGHEFWRREEARRERELVQGALFRCRDIARQWLAEDSVPVRAVCTASGDVVKASELIHRVPNLHRAFVSSSTSQRLADSYVVGQALVAGADLLVTNNRGSIDPDAVNEHVRQATGRNDSWMLDSACFCHGLMTASDDHKRALFAAMVMAVADTNRAETTKTTSVRRFLHYASHVFEPAVHHALAWGDAAAWRTLIAAARAESEREPFTSMRELERRTRDRIRQIPAAG